MGTLKDITRQLRIATAAIQPLTGLSDMVQSAERSMLKASEAVVQSDIGSAFNIPDHTDAIAGINWPTSEAAVMIGKSVKMLDNVTFNIPDHTTVLNDITWPTSDATVLVGNSVNMLDNLTINIPDHTDAIAGINWPTSETAVMISDSVKMLENLTINIPDHTDAIAGINWPNSEAAVMISDSVKMLDHLTINIPDHTDAIAGINRPITEATVMISESVKMHDNLTINISDYTTALFASDSGLSGVVHSHDSPHLESIPLPFWSADSAQCEQDVEIAELNQQLESLRSEYRAHKAVTGGTSVDASRTETSMIARAYMVAADLELLGAHRVANELSNATSRILKGEHGHTGPTQAAVPALEATITFAIPGSGQLPRQFSHLTVVPGFDEAFTKRLLVEVWKEGSARARHANDSPPLNSKESRTKFFLVLQAIELLVTYVKFHR